ncbi:acylphosphatase [Patescibacteria group bacterium]|nr:acylphosphatase [Patescibacteria group bacterium]
MTQEIKCSITGRVQMVMFRDFVRRRAQVLNLVGTVRNISDGSVEVIVQGPKEVLEEFITHLEKGSLLAYIDHVDVVWRKPQDAFSSFNIVY